MHPHTHSGPLVFFFLFKFEILILLSVPGNFYSFNTLCSFTNTHDKLRERLTHYLIVYHEQKLVYLLVCLLHLEIISFGLEMKQEIVRGIGNLTKKNAWSLFVLNITANKYHGTVFFLYME